MPDQMLILVPVILGCVAVFLLLPRLRPYPRWWGAALGSLALGYAGVLLIRRGYVPIEAFLFYVFAFIALFSGGMMITHRNPVHSALSFALVVLSSSGLFLLQLASFLMAANVIVYAGAIIVTFLFVIMLAQQAGPSDADLRSREPLIACVTGFVLLAGLLYILHQTYDQRDFDTRIARLKHVAHLDTGSAMAAELGNPEMFLGELQAKAKEFPYSEARRDLENGILEIRAHWDEWQNGDVVQLRDRLASVAELGDRCRAAGVQIVPPPARIQARDAIHSHPRTDHVGSLGRTLYTDYLLAIQLAGTLLLIATVGAIAITSRKVEAAS